MHTSKSILSDKGKSLIPLTITLLGQTTFKKQEKAAGGVSTGFYNLEGRSQSSLQ